MKRAKDVDEYIAHAPKETRSKLKALRAKIRSAAPKADERISYGMPHYAYHGRLIYFRVAKHHIGIYIPGGVLAEHKRELRDYETTHATVRLPLDKKLPVALIRKLVRARAKQIESKL